MPKSALASRLLLAELVLLNIIIRYKALDHGEESVSENATQSIFSWLQAEGYPPNKKHIHNWININNSDDEWSTDQESGKGLEVPRTNVEDWIDQTFPIINNCAHE